MCRSSFLDSVCRPQTEKESYAVSGRSRERKTECPSEDVVEGALRDVG